MKRVEYRKPSIEIVKIYNQTLLAGSDPNSIVENPNGGTESDSPLWGGGDGSGNDF